MITSKKLVRLIYFLNSLSDKGEKLELSEIDELLDNNKPLIKWLNNKYGSQFDISLLEQRDINQLNNYMCLTNDAKEPLDYKISNNGINLLIAYLLAGMNNINSDPNYFEQYNS